MADKVFNYGTDPSMIWQNLTYEDGSPIQGSHNWPFATVTINNWQNISAVNQALIISELTAKGYFEA